MAKKGNAKAKAVLPKLKIIEWPKKVMQRPKQYSQNCK